jgi:hypothetical protein
VRRQAPDDSTASGSGSETESEGSTAPEDLRVSDAEVATGLQQIDDLAGQVASGVADGDDAAADVDDQIEPMWASIEGTVKENDEDVYITFEDDFANLVSAIDDSDAEGAQAAADSVSDAVSSYLADHPG